MKDDRWEASVVAAIACLALASASNGQSGGSPPMYPAEDGPRVIDQSVPKGSGPRFTPQVLGRYIDIDRLLAHWKKIGHEDYILIESGLSKEAKTKLLLATPEKRAYELNREKGWYGHWYLIDSWEKQYRLNWAVGAKKKWIIEREIDGFSVRAKYASSADYTDLDGGTVRISDVGPRLRGPDGKEFYLTVWHSDKKSPRLQHMLFRERIHDTVHLVSIGGNLILKTTDQLGQSGAIWQVNENTFVGIATVGAFPTAVVEAYLEKYPSVYTKDFQYDRNEWARRKVDLELLRMRRDIAASSDANHQCWFYSALVELKSVGVNFEGDFAKNHTVDHKRKKLAEVEAWARESRDKLTWVRDPWAKFVVGDGPAKPVPLVTPSKKN